MDRERDKRTSTAWPGFPRRESADPSTAAQKDKRTLAAPPRYLDDTGETTPRAARRALRTNWPVGVPQLLPASRKGGLAS